jgi:histidine triad (HIT) family protein
MHHHEPSNYKCPFCFIIRGIEGDFPYTKQQDIFYRDDTIIAFIASNQWPNNKGHVIIIPLEHIENIYEMPDEILAKIHTFSKKIAIAIKEIYKCDGISFRQHNEPAGGQDVWHYHLHVFPRYINDNLYLNDKLIYLTKPEDRKPYADKLKDYFNN